MWLTILRKNVIGVALGKAIFIMLGNFLPSTAQTSVLSIAVVICAFLQSFLSTLLTEVSVCIIDSGLHESKDILNIVKRNYTRQNLILIPEAFGILGLYCFN